MIRRYLTILTVLVMIVVFSAPTFAQTSSDYFLHGTGPDNNPPTLVLNTTAPTATAAKFRDSASVNFSGGNVWKDIGTWPAAAVLTTGTLTALSDLHVWLGLKNSDDQGTQFDVRAEVLKNGSTVATGLTRCITGIVRNAANAKEVTVAFGSVPATPFNGTTDTLSVKISTRIGTNPDDTKCPGHNNAVGLRLYFDATSRNARFDATIATQLTPTIANFTPVQGPVGTPVTITGTNFDPVPANNTVQFNGVTALVTSATATTILATVPIGATTGPLTVTTAAGTATSATNFTVLAPPTLTSFSPATGRAGITVTVTGTNFTNVSAVTFNGMAATSFLVQTVTMLTAVVPPTATIGPLAVTTSGGIATSTGHFVVIPTQDMQLTVLPATVAIPSSGQASFAVSLMGSGGFTNVATLAVTGLPSGMTASFGAATLTGGQTTLLNVTTNGTTPAGSTTIGVTATGLVNGVSTTRSTTVTVQVQSAGTTTLSGTILDEEAKPVKGAVVTLGSLQFVSDDGGNFLFTNPPVGANQLMSINGGPASTPGRNLPIIPYKVTIVAGQANTLGFVPHLHFQKTTGMVDISNSGVERIVTEPELFGFQMRIPAGATITGWDGQVNTQISVRAVPMDRTPLPMFPDDRYSVTLFMDYFGKPGGGTASEPIPITYPNDLGLAPGAKAELWYYDEAPDGSRPNQWAIYGIGTVSPDGSVVVPDIDPSTGKQFGQPRFCCGATCIAVAVAFRPSSGSADPTSGGDPIDLATGQLTITKTDIVLPGRMPITFTRFYNSGSLGLGPLGTGWNHSYQSTILGQGGLRTLILPTGVQIAFFQQANGSYQNLTHPRFRGAVLTETSTSSTLRQKDGTTWTCGQPLVLSTGSTVAFLIAQGDRNGNTLTVVRDTSLQVTALIAPDGRQITVNSTGGLIQSLTDPLGRTVQYIYDPPNSVSGALAAVTDPIGGVTQYSYDSNGRLLTVTDPRGISYLTNVYDLNGRVIRQQLADGGVWQITYTVMGGIVERTVVTDPEGRTTTSRFNATNYLTDQTDGLGQPSNTLIRGASSNLVTASRDAIGRTTQYTYDVAGNVTKITDPALHETRFTYDAVFNRVSTITDALNQVTTFTYDPTNGNVLTVTDPFNHTTTITYNAVGQPISVTDPLTHTTTFAYDANGNLITTTDPLGSATQRVYDAVSRLTSLTDPRQLQTQFTYDALNRATAIVDARHGVTRFGYDGNGNLLTLLDAKGQPTSYSYDPMDRLFTRKDALNRSEGYQYDPAGNLTQFLDRKSQQSTFGYDQLNRRISASHQDGSSTNFVYDAVGRFTRITDTAPGAGAIDFFYDNLDRLILEVTAQGAVAYDYDAIGRRTKMTVAGQAPVTYGYDAASRLIQVAQGTLIVGIGYDAAGRRTSLTYPNGTSTSYTYDNASRLTRILHQGPGSTTIEDLVYAYDAAGNRTSLTRTNGTASLLPNAVASAAYDAANEQTAFAGATLTYDQNGNLTNDGANTYTWDARNRLIARSGPGINESFVYDALGRRISKTINGVTTSNLYDGNDIVAEIGSGAVGATYLRSLNIDEPFIRITTAGNEYYHTTALGSVLALTNATGAVATSYSYEAFGKTTITGVSSNPLQYTGRENDGNGLYYYRARYYSPSLQRFIEEDPIRLFSGTVNFYGYVSNNPLVFVDPFGLDRLLNPYPAGPNGPRITFDPGANNEVGETLADIVEEVVVDTGVDINVSATTNGTHTRNSLHYEGNALDINRVNGVHVSPTSSDGERLQKAFNRIDNVTENFGPFIVNKNGEPLTGPAREKVSKGHRRHIHVGVSCRKC